MRKPGREEDDVTEPALGEVFGSQGADLNVVADDARQADLRMVVGEVDDGNAVPDEALDETIRLRIAAQGDERTVSAPAAGKRARRSTIVSTQPWDFAKRAMPWMRSG